MSFFDLKFLKIKKAVICMDLYGQSIPRLINIIYCTTDVFVDIGQR